MAQRYLDCASDAFWEQEVFAIAGDLLIERNVVRVADRGVYVNSDLNSLFAGINVNGIPSRIVEGNARSFYSGVIGYHGTKACLHDAIMRDGLVKLDLKHLCQLVQLVGSNERTPSEDELRSLLSDYEISIRLDQLWFYYDVRMLLEKALHHTQSGPEVLHVLTRKLDPNRDRLELDGELASSEPLILRCKIPFAVLYDEVVAFVAKKAVLHKLYYLVHAVSGRLLLEGGFHITCNLAPEMIEPYAP